MLQVFGQSLSQFFAVAATVNSNDTNPGPWEAQVIALNNGIAATGAVVAQNDSGPACAAASILIGNAFINGKEILSVDHIFVPFFPWNLYIGMIVWLNGDVDWLLLYRCVSIRQRQLSAVPQLYLSQRRQWRSYFYLIWVQSEAALWLSERYLLIKLQAQHVL